MPAKWTFMVYMAGNNSLSDAASADLDEMRRVGSTDQIKVLTFVAQRRLKGEAQRFQIEKKGVGEKPETLKNVDSGNPQTVIDFIRWAVKKAPAEKYAIVLWNHGGGWEPDDLSQLYSEVRGKRGKNDFLRHEMNYRATQPIARTFFNSSVRRILRLPTERERAICSDDASGHSLDTIEVGNVIRLARQEIGHKMDLLGMDACLMSTLEVAYQVRKDVGVIVGSEELEPGSGWDYSALLADLVKDPDMDGKTLGQHAVQRYIESYHDRRDQWPVTQSAVDVSQIEPLSENLDAMAQALCPQLKTEWSSLYSAQSSSVSFGGGYVRLTDLMTLSRNLTDSPQANGIKKAAQNLVESLKPGNGYVLAEGHLGSQVDGVGGVSIYMPAPMEEVSRYYKDLAFAKKHHWSQLLQTYHAAPRKGR